MKVILLSFAFFLPCCLGAQSPDFSALFEAEGLQGSITLYDYRQQTWIYSDTVDARLQTLPASTFKILNSLIALDRKIVEDEHEVYAWDGVARTVPAWNADTDMFDAFRNSTVWFYQELARKIGQRPYFHYFRTCHFGNRTIGPDLDLFWLDGSLRISPFQQVEFLKRVYEEKRPFSAATYTTVKEMMVDQQTGEYLIRAKTGWGIAEAQDIGWWVGWVERGEEVYFFATRIWKDQQVSHPGFAAARKNITLAALQQLGWLSE